MKNFEHYIIENFEKVLKDSIALRNFVSVRSNWTQRAFARDKHNHFVISSSPEACSF